MTKTNLLVWTVLCVALGASLAAHFTQAAQAQPRPYRECYIMRLWDARGGELTDKLAPIPAGWTPVGGAGGDASKGVVLCR